MSDGFDTSLLHFKCVGIAEFIDALLARGIFRTQLFVSEQERQTHLKS